MNYLEWHVGMKVVCVNDRYKCVLIYRRWFGWRKSERIILHNLNRGDVYTVTGMDKIVLKDGRDHVGVFLAEAQHFDTGGPSLSFPAQLFRPVQTRKTDISVFTKLLKGKRVEVDA